ncbi:4Fe-4S binding protein [Phototrophicus methaneseepsis]|uniref:4Fe-4S binding protein n=1 Tax=Phototrophicus methaneseepsis TaxID=2710758 RepID=A0A7S8ICZ7_9CHLR|nr:4Fe-4S binding protein [Phototrophicus methaneseepsis]QPC81016.1 4Fe-4S binding protein [Phototrophicus methaneseepsis]
MWITFRHFMQTYVDDVRYGFRKYAPDMNNFEVRQGVDAQGAFTVQYPDEKLAMPERFRFVPFLVVEDYDHEERPGKDWCTSCGICAKVCPPQCIWIVRSNDPETGRPVPEPEAFFIDIDICMNCGFCAEFCPFDAIKMDHDYELASYDRTTNHIFDKEKLSKEFRYWKTIAPTRAIEEAEARGGWEHKDAQKAARRGGSARTSRTNQDTGRAEKREAVASREAVAEAPASATSAEDEKAKRREAALQRKAARAAKTETAESAPSEAEGQQPWNDSEDEKAKRREAALRRKAARAAKRADDSE